MTPAEGGRARVVFLWRAPQGGERSSPIRRVQSLERIAGTDVSFWSVELEADWRGSYCFIPMAEHLPPSPVDRRRWWLSLLERAEADPLNPVAPHAGAFGQPLSAAHLPGAPPQPDWEGAERADPGRLHRLLWSSARLPAADWAVLSDEERSRARRFHRHADRIRAAVPRAALRRLLAARLGTAPGALHFVAAPLGRLGR